MAAVVCFPILNSLLFKKVFCINLIVAGSTEVEYNKNGKGLGNMDRIANHIVN